MEKGNKSWARPVIQILTWALSVQLAAIPFNSKAQENIIKTYYDEGHTLLKEYYRVKDMKSREMEGIYQSYYLNGKTEVLGIYINNIPNGIWTYYYENGNVKMRGRLKGNDSYGIWKYYYENGQPSMEGEQKKSIRDGHWKFYFESGLLKSDGAFSRGEKSGIWNYNYEDGTLKAQAFYSGKLGWYKEFYTSGAVKMQGYQLNGESDSLWTYFYENGKKQAEGSYKQGLKQGSWVFYNEEGKRSSEGTYRKGEKNGQWTFYHDNGNVSSEGDETNGEKQGYWKLFNPQGQFIGDGTFESDSGICKQYYTNGQLKICGKVVDDRNEGKWLYYFEDGTLEGECLFVQGDGMYTGYYPSGKIKMKGEIKDGKNIGDWELFEPDGTLTGYYKPVYEEDKPVFKILNKTVTHDTLPRDNIKPEYYYRNRKNRYFTPVINEYRGFILASDPVATIIGSLPLSIEYYDQERLGHEVQIDIIRDPFYSNHASIEPNNLYKSGFDIAFRQKLYSRDHGFGMFYIANELRFSSIENSFNSADSISLSNVRLIKINKDENKYEYSFIVGNRWMQLLSERGAREKNKMELPWTFLPAWELDTAN